MKQTLIFMSLLASMCFPCSLCGKEEYATCFKSFKCGRLSNIRYPFWGGNRSLSCGYPGFELNCNANDDVPLLNISSISYRVLNIDFHTYTLTLARQDLWNNTCPKLLHKTTLDSPYFDFSSDSGDREVTLYYGCAAGDRGVKTMNASSRTCNGSISVRVNRTAAAVLENPRGSSIHVLQEALASGFSIQWSANNQNCENCGRAGGTCCFNRDTGATACSFRKAWTRRLQELTGTTIEALAPAPVRAHAHALAPASAPTTQGMPSSESPRYGPIIIGGGPRYGPGFDDYGGGSGGYPSDSSSTAGVIVGTSVTIGIVIFVVMFSVIIRYLERRGKPERPKQRRKQAAEKFLLQNGLPLKKYKYSEIKKVTKFFSDKLGQGGYGSVYKGTIPDDGSLVAVKLLMESDGDGEEFVNEVASISITSHVNIVSLLGYCYEKGKRALVYEYMPNKSLHEFLRNKNADGSMDLQKLYEIAVGIAKGLEYLHTGCRTRIVHFDIKPQNILLDEELCPKISDFGLAKLCKKKQSVLSVLGTRGTIGYIAPEVFSQSFGDVSYKSDVYSYGMMVLEMAGANTIIEDNTVQSSENYFPDKIYEHVIHSVTTKEWDDIVTEGAEEIAKKMFLVAFWCIQTSPSDRPPMFKVVEMLEGGLESIQIPPKPVIFTPTLPAPNISSTWSSYVETESSAEGEIHGLVKNIN